MRRHRLIRYLVPALVPALLALPVGCAAGEAPTSAAKTPPAAQRESVQLDASRKAGLLTDWSVQGPFGGSGAEALEKRFAPERKPKSVSHRVAKAELVFADGAFALPEALRQGHGVFYAQGQANVQREGEWSFYLEAAGAAVLFVDGRPVLRREAGEVGVRRVTLHATSGGHRVMVKFAAEAAPFRVAVMPPSGGSRRKHNTPYLRAVPSSEVMSAELRTQDK